MIKGKKVILGLLCLLFSMSAYGDVVSKSFNVDKADLIIGTSMRYIGLPYRWGLMDPRIGFDCSGFTKFVFAMHGYELPRTSRGQYRAGDKIRREECRRGDLVFFRGKRSRGVGHVGIIVDVYDTYFYFIHSCNSGIRIDSSDVSYYSKRYIGAVRILET